LTRSGKSGEKEAHTPMVLRTATKSPEETIHLGEILGGLLPKGSIVALSGELGAGKTILTKGIGRGLGVPDDREVTSPTFVLVNEYRGRVPVYHLDLYRLHEAGQVEDLGWNEFISGSGVIVIEWAERAPGLLPDDRVDVVLRWAGLEDREFVFTGIGPDGREAVRRLREKWEKEN
jgi:tRNA threonylcarbamoyladenosine biosynthesis protein TsaE